MKKVYIAKSSREQQLKQQTTNHVIRSRFKRYQHLLNDCFFIKVILLQLIFVNQLLKVWKNQTKISINETKKCTSVKIFVKSVETEVLDS